MTRREYVELIEVARDALHAVLERSTPNVDIDAWVTLDAHNAYRAAKRALARAGEQEAHEEDRQQKVLDDLRRGLKEITGEPPESLDRDALWQQGRAEWKGAPMFAREHLVIELIAEDRLSTSEVAAKLEEAVGSRILTTDAGNVLRRLWKAGELNRAADRLTGRVIYRYFRNTELSGPIAELEQFFDEPADGAG